MKLTGMASLVVCPFLFAAGSTTESGDTLGPDDYTEEIVVSAPAPKRGEVPKVEFIVELYDSRRKGAQLYREGNFEEAFPYLLTAAERGFKLAQARVGFMYQQGLGTERNGEEAMAWLGLAARSPSAPEIRNHFQRIWKKVPQSYHAGLLAKIDKYEAEFGAKANRVNCDYSRATRTRKHLLACRFQDQCRYDNVEATPEMLDCPRVVVREICKLSIDPIACEANPYTTTIQYGTSNSNYAN